MTGLETRGDSLSVDKHLDFEPFSPGGYNETYYSEVMQDEAELIHWQSTVLRGIMQEWLDNRSQSSFHSMIDVGSGPSVHHHLALAHWADKIVITDYAEANLREIRGWIDREPASHDWNPFTRMILESEGKEATPELVNDREEKLRSQLLKTWDMSGVIDLKKVDQSSYLNHFGRHDLATSFFVSDSATDDPGVFKTMLQNAIRFTNPGGLFVATFLGDCKQYRVGDLWFPSASVTLELAKDATKGAGNILHLEKHDVPEMGNEGFDNIITLVIEVAQTKV